MTLLPVDSRFHEITLALVDKYFLFFNTKILGAELSLVLILGGYCSCTRF
jgi:hypothetical protein